AQQAAPWDGGNDSVGIVVNGPMINPKLRRCVGLPEPLVKPPTNLKGRVSTPGFDSRLSVASVDSLPYHQVRAQPRLQLRRIAMTRFVQIVLLSALLVAVGPWAAAGDQNAEQEEAIAAIKQMKGFVEFDSQRPGKPVIKV